LIMKFEKVESSVETGMKAKGIDANIKRNTSEKEWQDYDVPYEYRDTITAFFEANRGESVTIIVKETIVIKQKTNE